MNDVRVEVSYRLSNESETCGRGCDDRACGRQCKGVWLYIL